MGSKNGGKLSVASIFFLGVNGIIGSGIFLIPGSLYSDAQLLTLLLVVGGVLAALLFGLCYAKMASTTTESGGAWLYAYQTFGKFTGFQVGFFTWVQGVATIATETAAFLTALSILIPALKSGSNLYNVSAIVIIAITMGIGILGQTASKIANDGATVFKILVLILFIGGGIMYVMPSNFILSNHYDITKINHAFVNCFYLYAGFSFLPIAAQKMVDPEKNLPKVLIAMLVFCGVMFLLVVGIAIGMLGNSMSGSEAPLALAFSKFYGPMGKFVIVVGMAASILGVIISLAYSTPFIASSLAIEHQLLPAFFGRSTRNGTPYVSIVLTGLLGIALVLTGGYLFLVPLCVLIGLVQYTTTALAAYKAQKKPTESGAFKLPFGGIIPILALLTCIYMLVNMEMKTLYLGLGLLVCGFAIYFLEKVLSKNKPAQTIKPKEVNAEPKPNQEISERIEELEAQEAGIQAEIKQLKVDKEAQDSAKTNNENSTKLDNKDNK